MNLTGITDGFWEIWNNSILVLKVDNDVITTYGLPDKARAQLLHDQSHVTITINNVNLQDAGVYTSKVHVLHNTSTLSSVALVVTGNSYSNIKLIV